MTKRFSRGRIALFYGTLALSYLAVFLLGPFAVLFTDSPSLFTVLSSIGDFIRATIPVFVFAVLFLSYDRFSGGLFLSALFLSIPRVLTVLPDAYLSFFSDWGLETSTALPFALLLSVIDLAVAALLYSAAAAVLHRIAKSKSETAPRAAFSTENPVSFSVLLFGATFSLYRLILSVIDGISFFVANFSSFLMGDVLTAVLDLVLIFSAFLIAQFLVFPVIGKLES